MTTKVVNSSLNFTETIDIICEFLQAAIHLILYVRELYPHELFEKQTKYNISIPMSKHPELSGYIYDMILACKPDLEKGSIEKIHLIILKDDNIPIERFVFKLNTLIDQNSNNNDSSSKLNLKELEGYFRDFLLNLSQCNSILSPNPKGCTFALVMQLKQGSPHSKSGEFPWIPAEHYDPSEIPDSNQTNSESINNNEDGINLKDSFNRLIPLKDMNTGLISMNLWVEESIYKGKLITPINQTIFLDDQDSSSPPPIVDNP